MTIDAGPLIADAPAREIADRVHIIPDGRVPLVPSPGFVVGDEAVLVIDTGMGPRNGERVLAEARRLAAGRRLYLTLTHFHPEHAFGAQAFAGEATIIYNQSQADELAEKGAEFLEMFRGFGPGVAACLEGVELVDPDITYGDFAVLDLGGVTAELRHHGHAHTHGDQTVYIREPGVLFTGDLVETRLFPLLPDDHAHGSAWIGVLDHLAELRPAVVVPGHGEVGGAELITAIRDYLVDVRGRVSDRRANGEELAAFQEPLAAAVRADYADWEAEEWIAPALERFFLEPDDGRR